MELKVNESWERFLGAYTAQQTIKNYKRILKQFMTYIYKEEWRSIDRWAFISSEAKAAIIDWLNHRDEYLITAVARSKAFGKSSEDYRLFPFGTNVAYMMWRNALNRTKLNGGDKTTNRHELHPHVLRKFFRTNHRAIVDIREAIMGHEGYLTEAYRKYSPEQLAKFYKEGAWGVLIFSETGKMEKLRKELENKTHDLQTLINSLATENLDLREKVRRNETSLNNLNQVVLRVVQDIMPILHNEDIVELSDTFRELMR